MTVKDTAVTAFVLGLVTGMIVAFASCSTSAPDPGQPPPASPAQTLRR